MLSDDPFVSFKESAIRNIKTIGPKVRVAVEAEKKNR